MLNASVSGIPRIRVLERGVNGNDAKLPVAILSDLTVVPEDVRAPVRNNLGGAGALRAPLRASLPEGFETTLILKHRTLSMVQVALFCAPAFLARASICASALDSRLCLVALLKPV